MNPPNSASVGEARFLQYATRPSASVPFADDASRVIAHGGKPARRYLELIARANSISDPFDPRVVEAFWIGNSLLDQVTPEQLEQDLGAWLHDSTNGMWGHIDDATRALVRPHHNLHVFAVYPW